jgi:hypothetical protein
MGFLVERRWEFCLTIELIRSHQQIVISSEARDLRFAANCRGLRLAMTER